MRTQQSTDLHQVWYKSFQYFTVILLTNTQTNKQINKHKTDTGENRKQHVTLLKLSSMLRKAEFCISFMASAQEGRGQDRSGSGVTKSI